MARWPRAVGRPGLPQTRTCIFDAYGSSDHGLATLATRCCFVETVLEFRCIRCLPNNGSIIRRLASLQAVRAVPFPPFPGTIKALRLAAVRCAALRFLRLALPRAALNPVETSASPKFLGNLNCAYARFYDSGVTARSSPYRCAPHGPREGNDEGSHNETFEAH
jgi:hypothetical protein